MTYTVELRSADNPPNIQPMLIWTDIPYNTGKIMTQGGNSYRDSDPLAVLFALGKWAELLHPNGTMVVCCDYRMASNVVEALTPLEYLGEIIWEFGLGRPRERWWPVRHNNLLTFAHSLNAAQFHHEAVPRVKRLAPKPGYSDDKPSGSVWEFTLSNTHPERVGYPNQKPLAIISPFILAHTSPGELVADPFCGSASTGVAAIMNGRTFYGADTNPQAISIATARLAQTARGN